MNYLILRLGMVQYTLNPNSQKRQMNLCEFEASQDYKVRPSQSKTPTEQNQMPLSVVSKETQSGADGSMYHHSGTGQSSVVCEPPVSLLSKG